MNHHPDTETMIGNSAALKMARVVEVEASLRSGGQVTNSSARESAAAAMVVKMMTLCGCWV